MMPALPWHRALVVGLGKSGRAAATLLSACDVAVRGYDQRNEIDGIPAGVETVLGRGHPPDSAFSGVDLVVLSPGVPPEPVLASVRRLAPDAEIHGELGLALELVRRELDPWSRVPSVLVTGTNGKSTVTALLGRVLEADGRAAFVGGNLGDPLAQLLSDAALADRDWPEALVLECSSFQLETLGPYPADVAMVLNVSADHLDRYASLEAYARTKARVFAGQGREGLAILDANDPFLKDVVPRDGPSVELVGGRPGGHIEGNGSGETLVLDDGTRYDRGLLRVPGRHNAKNALFALLAARRLGVTPAACREGLAAFTGLPHRMSHVAEIAGITFYDDSKATNVASVVASLSGFERPVVLIAGGRPKGDDLSLLRPLFGAPVRAVVALGEATPALVELCDGQVDVAAAENMEDAVQRAHGLARGGDAVVLSPACASYDMYANYARRGEAFAVAVRSHERERE